LVRISEAGYSAFLGSGIKHINVIVEKNIKCYIAGQERFNG
jgi:hypothetical protein